ncbi:MAG: hypothetical protein VXZ40_03260 [Nanoarchaeota archaeon]|nr:hypothetical protein [Nanoarchaeota archaeon]
MNKIFALFISSLLLVFSACSQVGGLASEVEENKIQREEDQSKSIEERQEETLSQLIQDGVYIEEVTYRTPAGEETLEITFQITNDIVDEVSLELVGEANPTSQRYAQQSEAGLRNLLEGKNINDVEIPNSIAGSSLTTTAFKNHIRDLTVRY